MKVAEKITCYETMKHVRLVAALLSIVVGELLKRAYVHDVSKMDSPELEAFTKLGPHLSRAVYGSDEYKALLRGISPAVEHHNANNRHHPEHFSNGVAGMNLVDLVEMLCDWKAASLRQEQPVPFVESIEKSAERFNLDPQLKAILLNTVELLEGGGLFG